MCLTTVGIDTALLVLTESVNLRRTKPSKWVGNLRGYCDLCNNFLRPNATLPYLCIVHSSLKEVWPEVRDHARLLHVIECEFTGPLAHTDDRDPHHVACCEQYFCCIVDRSDSTLAQSYRVSFLTTLVVNTWLV
jgi:hypothetical protein